MTRRTLRCGLAMVSLLTPAIGAAQPRIPTVDDLLGLASVSDVQIAPQGMRVAYAQVDTDMARDRYVTSLWVVDIETSERRRLSAADVSIARPRWSPDGQWIAFLAPDDSGRTQIHAVTAAGNESRQLTRALSNVLDHAWSPDGRRIAFTAADETVDLDGQRPVAAALYTVVGQEHDYVRLHVSDVATATPEAAIDRVVTPAGLHVTGFAWAPDGDHLAMSATSTPALKDEESSDIFVVALRTGLVTAVASQPGFDTQPIWSPSGDEIAFQSALGRPRFYPQVLRLAVVSAAGGPVREVRTSLDESPTFVAWNADGLYVRSFSRASAHLYRIDVANGTTSRITAPASAVTNRFSLTRDGRTMALLAATDSSLPEVVVSPTTHYAPQPLTDFTSQIRGLLLGTREVVSWRSRDGTPVEGVLIKPADFDPERTYPLLCIIHGGPDDIDLPILMEGDARYYPADIWTGRGAVVLKVNYRGSIGYGAHFRGLGVGRMGTGEADDILSGIEHLIAQGWVDTTRIATMGWSQGGYLSALLTTKSPRFVAASVGAAIVEWTWYYYTTDLTPFTVNYLGGQPRADDALAAAYRAASPLTHVANVRTPTLIQHGSADQRVPFWNAHVWRQALEDQGVPVQMIAYRGFGHGISRPPAQRALMLHNVAWFNHWLWGDRLPSFTAWPRPDSSGLHSQGY